MLVDGVAYRSIWFDADRQSVEIIDQRWLPHEFRVAQLESRDDFATAIRDMWVRGAPLIGATAAYGIACEMRRDPSDEALGAAWETLHATRPTAINLRWALNDMRHRMLPLQPADRAAAAFRRRRKLRRQTSRTTE